MNRFSEKGEVFTKANLSELPKNKTKLKRELCGGSKLKSRPSAKRQKDNAQLKSKKMQLANQENRSTAVPTVGLTKPKNGTSLSSRLGVIRPAKAIVSETVPARKTLGSLDANVEGLPTKDQLYLDLQRVLGKDVNKDNIAPPPMSPPTCQKVQSETNMECSPTVGVDKGGGTTVGGACQVPLVEISQRLIEGLQVDVIFPHSCYLDNIKAELKKVLKQSNPFNYDELVGYFTSSQTPSLQEMCSAEDAILSEMGRPPELVGSACPMVTSDIVALNLEVNTSALNINDHTPTPDHARPKDFLDLMDSTLPPPTNGTSREWETTPTRPHMFPHKLY